jgi:hypothetical protein
LSYPDGASHDEEIRADGFIALVSLGAVAATEKSKGIEIKTSSGKSFG